MPAARDRSPLPAGIASSSSTIHRSIRTSIDELAAETVVTRSSSNSGRAYYIWS